MKQINCRTRLGLLIFSFLLVCAPYALAQSSKDCTIYPEMVIIPAGAFQMGAKEGEANNKPVRSVRIKSFALAKTEVTFAQWEACVTDGSCNGVQPGDGGRGRGNHPVIDVSWEDAQAYVQWLSKKTRWPTACPARPSGNTRREAAPVKRIHGVMHLALAMHLV